jgi:hypothetical protein
MIDWFRGHVAAQKIAGYRLVAGAAGYFVRDVGTAVFFTLAFVLGDRWIFTFLPDGWDQRRARVAPDWLVLGVLVGCGVTVPLWLGTGLFVVAAIIVMARRAELRSTLDAGLPLALAATSAWLAWANRPGPGEVCPALPASGECRTYSNPWPFAVAAVVLLLVAVAVEFRRSRRSRLHDSAHSQSS